MSHHSSHCVYRDTFKLTTSKVIKNTLNKKRRFLSYKLPSVCSVFAAEFFVIFQAINIVIVTRTFLEKLSP